MSAPPKRNPEIFDPPEPDIRECETPPDIVLLQENTRLRISMEFSQDFRIRRVVGEKLAYAAAALPDHLCLIVYEAFRPRERQRELWESVYNKLSAANPGMQANILRSLCATWVADPYKPVGSGHQSAAAVDVALGNSDGMMLEFGTAMQEFNAFTRTDNSDISPEAMKNRRFLKLLLEEQGLVNYPAEWWHFSYGDRLWAQVTGTETAFFGPID